MEKRDKEIFWLLIISLIITGVLGYLFQTELKSVLISSFLGIACGITNWILSFKIKSNGIIAYLIGLLLGLLGLIIYVIFYFLRKSKIKKQSEKNKLLSKE